MKERGATMRLCLHLNVHTWLGTEATNTTTSQYLYTTMMSTMMYHIISSSCDVTSTRLQSITPLRKSMQISLQRNERTAKCTLAHRANAY